jgi:sterol desaturase/sphingolipid hydroxylase (fatty acid hydroxylase superfamily)
MNDVLLIRLATFLGIMVLMGSWEVFAPRRRLTISQIRRWSANLSVVVLDIIVIRLLFAAGGIGAAMFAAERGWGLLNHLVWPGWSKAILAVVALDFALYLQHRLFHIVPAFWRFHMMHHADLDCDVTTGVRFHPVEVALSMLIKLSVILLLGPSPAAVLSFEVVLNATSLFNHSNVRMPSPTDRVLRWIIVTPDMHRIHHSIDPRETNRNFGFNVSWWDRLLGTYRAKPALGHEGMILGLEQFRDPPCQTLIGILMLPFTCKSSNLPGESRGPKS